MPSKETGAERTALGMKSRAFEAWLGGGIKGGTGTSSRNRAKVATFWSDSQRKVSVYEHMPPSKATHDTRIPNSLCLFARKGR